LSYRQYWKKYHTGATPKLHLKKRLDWIVFIVERGMEAIQDMRLLE